MFTGIVQAVGEVRDIVENNSGDRRFLVVANELDFANLQQGDSICCNGVCLTATDFYRDQQAQGFWADVSSETLRCTTFAEVAVGSGINLEKSVTPSTALGGHLVSGHVDGVGKVVKIAREAESFRYRISVAKELARYIASKGSICIDGTSLTVNEVTSNEFGINIIPHTFENTIFSAYQEGACVNIEVDMIARYVERLLSFS